MICVLDCKKVKMVTVLTNRRVRQTGKNSEHESTMGSFMVKITIPYSTGVKGDIKLPESFPHCLRV